MKEKHLTYRQRYYRSHKEKELAYGKKWRKDNPEYNRKWQKNNTKYHKEYYKRIKLSCLVGTKE